VPYNLPEHRHRFAVWAAARAAQRGFTTIDELRGALEATDLRHATADPKALQLHAVDFETMHRRWCTTICATLVERGILGVSFGRAAKLVAVYLKATVLMGEAAASPVARHMHPPIDRTLLQNLASAPGIESPHKANWRKVSWTRLTEPSYYELIEQLRAILAAGMPFWMLEEYWSPTDEQ
jgi:hypothetical protein